MTTVHYADDEVTVYHGDCLDVLAELPDASVDSVCTDPPYGISFMGRQWDQPGQFGSTSRRGGGPNHRRGHKDAALNAGTYDLSPAALANFQRWCNAWSAECLRILKPGGHLLSFGGSRTWHRLTAGIEDAGFEIRDSIAWLYSQGFPKSLNVAGDNRFCQCNVPDSGGADGDGQLHGVRSRVSDLAEDASAGEVSDLFATMQRQGSRAPVGDIRPSGRDGAEDVHSASRASESGLAGRCDAQAAEGELQGRSVCALPGGVPGDGAGGWLRDGTPSGDGDLGRPAATANRGGQSHRPQSGEQRPVESGAVSDERGPQARRGWPICGRCGKQSVVGLGTALKPAFEPIVVARKPFAGTVAANVAEYGTGGLYIDGCRVPTSDRWAGSGVQSPAGASLKGSADGALNRSVSSTHDDGRWPANVLLDEQQAAELDRQSGTLKSGANPTRRGADDDRRVFQPFAGQEACIPARGANEGGASRFFPVFRYEAKAPGAERPTVDGAAHPTVKPLDLMRWLVRLVTPPNGVVLDPFAGSGTTAEACIHEHMRCITIERESEYLPLIVARLSKPIAIGFDFGEGN